jgi:uncharacterized protein (DUF2336 family)
MEGSTVAPASALNATPANEVAPGEVKPPAQTIVRRLLARAQAADPGERADAASALARAYRYSDLPAALRSEAVVGLMSLLDDRSILVRRALAEALASARDAPHSVIVALAHDQPEIAAVVVARSPMLNDADLVDCAAVGDEGLQIALARRPALNAGPAAALAEIGTGAAALALLENHEAVLTEDALRRIAQRFGKDGEIREMLLARPWLPATLRCDLVAATATALSPLAAAFGLGERHIEKLMREAREEGAVAVANDAEGDDLSDLIRHLRRSGALTIAVLMRGLVSGDRAIFETALAELSGAPQARVAAFARTPLGAGFAALYRRSGLPRRYFAPFRTALAALNVYRAPSAGAILRPVVALVIGACEQAHAPELDRLLSLLRRLEAEGALEEARAFVAEVVAEEACAYVAEAVAEEARAFVAKIVAEELSPAASPPPVPMEDIEPPRIGKPPPLLLMAINGLGDAELLPTMIDYAPYDVAEAA